ncbi:MAG: DUF4091 domain-containing protein [Thermoguttaceae bacterium]|nr:DUF4091 domain-containing protein [Thermoguttaceae bacterium]
MLKIKMTRFPSFLLVLMFVASTLFAQENLLRDPGMESLGENRSPWFLKHKSTVLTSADGTRSLHIETDESLSCGAMQVVEFDPPIRAPFRFGGRAKLDEKAVRGGKGATDFDVYLDVFYEDGTPLWGVKAQFDPETLGWQTAEAMLWPEKPIKKLQFFVLFRDYIGKVTFDDFYLVQETFQIRMDQTETVGGLSGDGSIAMWGHFDWHKDFLPENLRYVLTQDGLGEIPLEFRPDGTGFFVSARPEKTGGVKTFRFKAFSGEKELAEKVFQLDTTRLDGENATVWTESSMRRVYLTTLPEVTESKPLKKSAELDLARNEAESFQVLVHSGVDLNGVHLAFSDLVSDSDPAVKIPASALEWQEVGFLPTPEIVEHPLEKSGCPRWFPDPLLPRKNGFVPAGQTVSFWVTVTTQAETQPGTYRGTVRMTADGDALAPVEIPLTVNVFPAVIPAEGHLGTAFALMDGFLEKVYGPDCDLPALRKTYDAYMVKCRLAPEGDISRTEMPSLERLQEWKGKGLGYFNILNMVHKRGRHAWTCNSSLDFYTPENREKFLAELRPYVESLRELGLTDRAYIYTFDESREEMHPAIKDFFGMVKENFPEIATFSTAYIHSDSQKMKELNIDWICPLTAAYDRDREKVDECRRNGQKVWSYICCGPLPPYANIMLRFPLIECRTLGWQSYVEKYDGLLYWGVNIWNKEHNVPFDPEETLFLDWDSGVYHGHSYIYGDGRLMYPAADGTPIGSIRLANLRDGLEDYELLYLLEQKNPELAKKLSEEATPSPVNFTHDPEVIRTLKRKVLQALE